MARQRARDSLNRIDARGVALRLRHTLHRRKYSVAGPNSLWHVDGSGGSSIGHKGHVPPPPPFFLPSRTAREVLCAHALSTVYIACDLCPPFYLFLDPPLDGYHKLIRWKICIHGGIDGFSHEIVYLAAADNNRSSTVLQLFLRAVEQWFAI